jgi:hypothetical protein
MGAIALSAASKTRITDFFLGKVRALTLNQKMPCRELQ